MQHVLVNQWERSVARCAVCSRMESDVDDCVVVVVVVVGDYNRGFRKRESKHKEKSERMSES